MYEQFQAAIYNGVGIALIRRAASTSIKRSIEQVVKVCPMSDKGVQPGVPVIAFIRDPLERFYSGAKGLPDRYCKYPHDRTFHEHVDHVLSGADDPHWTPQAEILEGIKDLTYHPFEKISEAWQSYQLSHDFPSLLHEHKSEEVKNRKIHDIDYQYRRGELKIFYAADYEMREPWR